jgi:BlaI family transcriptional regulator, penicillinase repressor
MRSPNSPPLPTAGELDILAALWRIGPSTVRAVHDLLGKQGSYTTTLKQMQLMLQKKLLLRGEESRSHVYEPALPKESTQKQIAEDLLRRAFDGSAKSLVLGALSARPASAEDLEEIQRMLESFRKARKSR